MKKRLSAILLSMLLLVGVSSCASDDWNPDYYYSPLLGAWQLNSVNGIPVDEADVAIFDFYDNGTGTYQRWTGPNLSVWSTYSISWECDFPNDVDNYLYVYTWTGETWIYRFRVYAMSLTLVDTLNGNVLTFGAI